MHALTALLLLASPDVPSEAFTEAEAVGRRLAETNQVIARATQVLLAQKHDAPVNTFFALQRGDAWVVYFGALDKAGKRFTPAYVLGEKGGTFAQLDPKSLTDDVTPFARAVDASRVAAAKATHNPHVNAILAPEQNGIGVYVLQASADADTTLLGGDFYDRYDPTGTRLQAHVALHEGVVPIRRQHLDVPQLAAHPNAQVAGSFHKSPRGAEPTATDVATAILHPAITPLVALGAGGKAYAVDAQGHVTRAPDFDGK